MAHLPRSYRHLKPVEPQKNKPSFFSPEKTTIQKQGGAFFQAKLSIGEPDGKYEKEADSVANNVVNNINAGTIQKKKISDIQRLATSKEDELTSTDEERMRRDKEIQRMPDTEPKKEEEDKMKKMSSVQRKPESGGTASPQVSSRIEQTAGKGQPMASRTLSEMQSSFGLNLQHVNIHTDAGSVAMNKELGAQAFTHGNDIFFNSGKYDPESTEGKKLLAHELTHVVQQTGSEKLDDKHTNSKP